MKNGPTPKDRNIIGVRALVPADLERLKAKRDPNNLVQKLRDPHHLLARCLASGMTHIEAAEASGYSTGSVNLLTKDPTFLELVEHYRGVVLDQWKESLDSFHTLAHSNMLKAERQIAEKLEIAEENKEQLPTRELIAISRDAADRLGYGKKQTNLNVNVDFAAQLEKSIRRSDTVRQIEGRVVTIAPPSPGAQPAVARQPLPLGPIRRRA